MAKPKRLSAIFSIIQIKSLLIALRSLTDDLSEAIKRPGMLSLPVLPVYSFYAIRYFCAAIAAFAPSAAAVIICRSALVRISPAAKMPG